MTIGFSPCPNDTFMFYALVHGLVDTEGLVFEPVMADVEQLNRLVLSGSIDAGKASYRAIAKALDHYNLLLAGSALGRGCGPLLVSRDHATLENGKTYRVLIPGENTTANFLLETFYPQLDRKTAVLFSDIELSLVNGSADLGVIIHENRFTYKSMGLVEIDDLGSRWEHETGLPIPLGGIVVRSDLDSRDQRRLNRALRRSVEYAFAHPSDVMPYVREHAQAMSDIVMQQHIALYVNTFSIDLGDEGLRAVDALMERNGIVNCRNRVVPF